MMRTATLCIFAAALAATPAAAQNDTSGTTVVANTVTANEVVPADANTTMPVNDMAAAPVAAPEETAAVAPEPKERPKNRDLPWGAIGLVGLVGLLGRKRRGGD
jgi:hypothetical protein